ncbi:MAG: hypothetical protein HY455_03625 [Parcubacteria group bacterium]|nr:hypothetical protein [Parcubacteria group bacterium]
MQKWKWFAIGEGLSKTFSSVLQKMVGMVAKVPGSFELPFLGSLVVGTVQMLGGALLATLLRKPLLTDRKLILGSLWFGFFGFLAGVAGVLTFSYEDAALGIVGFIFTMGIVLKALADWIFFKNVLNLRQWMGVGVYLVAGYALFNFPGFGSFTEPPVWVFIATIIPVTITANEIITRKMSMSQIAHPFVHNFWAGASTMFFALIGLSFVGVSTILSLSSILPVIVLIFLISGTNVIMMISFKLLSYDGGKTTLSLKTLIMTSWQLVTMVIVGVTFFGEPLTFGKLLSIPGFMAAYVLIDVPTWEVFVGKAKGLLRA